MSSVQGSVPFVVAASACTGLADRKMKSVEFSFRNALFCQRCSRRDAGESPVEIEVPNDGRPLFTVLKPTKVVRRDRLSATWIFQDERSTAN
jgi:hypothetical protein